MPERKLPDRLRRDVGHRLFQSFFEGLSRVGRMHPQARPARHDLEVLRDIPYRDTAMVEHRLDVYRPRVRTGLLPVVLYVHGGSFRMLSKETHWIMALAFARQG